GLIPDAWLEGIICPIYKGKGDPAEPSNYRPITILSCFGKLFTAVLNMRLNNFLNYYDLLNQNQAGFRAGFSTNDHIFALHAIIELLKSKNKKLFCSFIDFSKAFDSVWRVGLWMKLLSNGINGKFFRLIYNLYYNIKSCVHFAGEQSRFFHSYSGVRQGENLS
ncbi:MAG: reverse transcriptase family protein, partial [Candidatus Thiodiazotropha sp.]